MKLTPYNSNDIEEITQLFVETFSDSEGESEGKIIGGLVRDIMGKTDSKDLYGFSASEKGKIVGCIFFTRMTFQNGISAFLLSPVAVHSAYQGRQIGQNLIKYGIDQLKADQVSLVITYGDPAFYSKAGFKQITEQTVEPPFALSHPEGWLGLSLSDEEIKPIAGRSSCIQAFNRPELW